MPRSPKKTASLPSPDETAPLELDLLQALMQEAEELSSDLARANLDDGDADSAGETGEAEIPALLPLVPIRDNVYFPHMIFPLLVGRDRSVKAMEAASESEARFVVLAAQRDVLTEDPEPGDIYDIGIIAEVMQLFKMPDNTVRVMLEGTRRVRLSDFVQSDPFMLVRVETLDAEDADDDAGESAAEADGDTTSPVETEALVRTISGQFERIVAEGRNIPPEVLANLSQMQEPGAIADTIIPYLSLRVEEKQSLLETLNIGERLEKLGAVLHKEFEILEVQKNIRARVEREMEGNQREFILREQLKAIQQELGERVSPFGDDKDGEEAEWREKIAAAKMPEAVEERALKELDRWEKNPACLAGVRHYPQLSGLARIYAVERRKRRHFRDERGRSDFRRRPLGVGKSQGANAGVFGGSQTCRVGLKRPDFVLCRPARCGKNEFGQIGCPRSGPQIYPRQFRRRAR